MRPARRQREVYLSIGMLGQDAEPLRPDPQVDVVRGAAADAEDACPEPVARDETQPAVRRRSRELTASSARMTRGAATIDLAIAIRCRRRRTRRVVV